MVYVSKPNLLRNGVIVPRLPNSEKPDELKGEILISELRKHCDDLAILEAAFGPKLATLLTWPEIRDIMFRDHKKLNLACLSDNDLFTMRCFGFTEKQKLALEQNMDLQTSQPLLFWLYPVLLKWFHPSTAYSALEFNFTPTTLQSGQSPLIDLKLKSDSKARKFIELTIYRGGEYDKRETFTAYIQEPTSSRKLKWGEPASGAMDLDIPVEPSLHAVFDYLFPRAGNKWRIAMEDFHNDDDEAFLNALIQGMKASDDSAVYNVSVEQQEQCIRLFERFPPEAQKALRGNIGSCGGRFSHEAMRRYPRY
jgi:hypothetical protein